ncbi:unnamed protein product [Nezara viridula]|uniref:Sodium/calcium exchanger membrane region domain-containing protein n=1 Tax=Nezara viridula TaxID=85310 RepID=A0A9P0HAC2_NEZVI|nr:unnamed protein product [Nezara viridula]
MELSSTTISSTISTTMMAGAVVQESIENTIAPTRNQCHYVMTLPYKERCDFVMSTDDCGADGSVLMNTFRFIFCDFSEEQSYIGIIITVCVMAFVFITTAFVADGFICTNLAVISRSLKLPDSIAGVTLLALGNGIPDLFTAFAGAELNHPEILFSSLTGAALFDVTIAAGCVIFLRPFYIDSFTWWNVIFYLLSYGTLFCGFYFRNLSVWHSVGIISIYVCYGVFTVTHFVLSGPHEETEPIDETDEEHLIQIAKAKTFTLPPTSRGTLQSTVELLKAMERSRLYRVMGYRYSIRRSADFGYSWRRPKHLIIEFLNFLDFRDNYDWYEGSACQKIAVIVQLPWIIGLKFLIPAVIPGILINDGWCKLLAMINSLIYFDLLLYCFGVSDKEIGPFQLWQYGLVLGLLFFFLILFTSRTSLKPKYHTNFKN